MSISTINTINTMETVEAVYESSKYRGKKYESLADAMKGQRLNQLIHTLKNKEYIKEREHLYYISHVKPIKDKQRADKRAEKLLMKREVMVLV
jgi:hypothetical protein